MLIIGHRGAAGEMPENTLAGFMVADQADVDIIHLDVRLTKDGVVICLHDNSLLRTHQIDASVSSLTYEELKALLERKTPPRLATVLKRYSGKRLLILEIRSRGSGGAIARQVADQLHKIDDWDAVVFSSFHTTELFAVRRAAPHANLALMHDLNPFSFVASERLLHYTAVGFHRLHTNRLALDIAKRAGIFTFTYTVNRPEAAERLETAGFDGIMTNYPSRMNRQPE